MKDTNTLRHIAGLYLDIYSAPRDLDRPLTPEQVKDAGVFFLDLLAAHEAEALIEKEREAASRRSRATGKSPRCSPPATSAIRASTDL